MSARCGKRKIRNKKVSPPKREQFASNFNIDGGVKEAEEKGDATEQGGRKSGIIALFFNRHPSSTLMTFKPEKSTETLEFWGEKKESGLAAAYTVPPERTRERERCPNLWNS